MKQTKWIVAGLLVVGAIISAKLLVNRPPARTANVPVAPLAQAPSTPEMAPPEEPAAPQAQPTLQSLPESKPSSLKPQKTAPNQAPKPSKEPLHDPDAREALAMVGLDPQAEQYWLEAIFDSSLPDNEREDLMEDLNEVGFGDPKNLTADDLPLIVNRLQIIQELEPNLDPFMQEHLGEAYKDLANMYVKAAGQ